MILLNIIQCVLVDFGYGQTQYLSVELKQILDSFIYLFGYTTIQKHLDICTVNDRNTVILAYFVINPRIKDVSVITCIMFNVFPA